MKVGDKNNETFCKKNIKNIEYTNNRNESTIKLFT